MRLRLAPWLVLLAGLAASCRTYVPPPSVGGPGAVAPPAAVERLLQYAAAKEYLQMGWVFGTADGPVIKRDPPSDVERRMYALASVLEHSEFSVTGQSPVPGRTGGAVQMPVRLVQRGRTYTVPFTAVRGPDGRWFVENVDVTAITANLPPAR